MLQFQVSILAKQEYELFIIRFYISPVRDDILVEKSMMNQLSAVRYAIIYINWIEDKSIVEINF